MWLNGSALTTGLLVWGVVSVAGAQTPTAAPTVTEGPLAYPERPDFVLLEYSVRHEMLAEPDPTPLLRIYGDGRVLVHYPPYMKRAGDYELRLERAELREMLQSLHSKGVLDFDTRETKRLAERLAEQRAVREGELFARSDVSHTVIAIYLDRYAPAGAAASIDDFAKTVAWPDLQQQAARHPDIVPLQGVAAAERELRQLLEDDRLRPLQR